MKDNEEAINIGLLMKKINKGVFAGILIGIGLMLIGFYFGYKAGFYHAQVFVDCSQDCWRLIANGTI
jgi:hypothetical protein